MSRLVEVRGVFGYVNVMDAVIGQQGDEAKRLADEAELIAAASDSVEAGRTVSFKDVQDWANSLGTPHEG